MQDLILIISRCISVKEKVKSKRKFYKFHFRGFYQGVKINSIHLNPMNNDQVFDIGEDYLLWTKKIKIINDVLIVELIKHKLIN